MLYELLYTSAAVKDMDTDDLLLMLEQARTKNARLGVTGMLLYHNREFMQLIEGEREDILALWETIRSDERHTSARVVFEAPIKERGFANWTMGFRNLSDINTDDLEGFSDYLDKGFTSELRSDTPSVARDLMVFISGFLFDS